MDQCWRSAVEKLDSSTLEGGLIVLENDKITPRIRFYCSVIHSAYGIFTTDREDGWVFCTRCAVQLV